MKKIEDKQWSNNLRINIFKRSNFLSELEKVSSSRAFFLVVVMIEMFSISKQYYGWVPEPRHIWWKESFSLFFQFYGAILLVVNLGMACFGSAQPQRTTDWRTLFRWWVFGPQLNLTTFSIGITTDWKHALGGRTLWVDARWSDDLAAAHYRMAHAVLKKRENSFSLKKYFWHFF